MTFYVRCASTDVSQKYLPVCSYLCHKVTTRVEEPRCDIALHSYQCTALLALVHFTLFLGVRGGVVC
jgi:hypothetical protein